MKTIQNILIALALMLLTGCIKDSMADCARFSDIRFVYDANGNTNIINQYIDTVDMYVFDANHNLVMVDFISKNELLQNQGKRVALDTGLYYIVCWGNATQKSIIDITQNMQASTLTDANLYNNKPIVGIDSLYYSLCEIRIGEERVTKREIKFECAHIKFEIYVKGRTDMDINTPQNMRPAIDLGNISARYNFYMYNQTPTIYRPNYVYNKSHDAAETKFNTMRFDEKDNINLKLYIPQTGELLYTLDVNAFAHANNIKINGINEVTIPILITFGSLGVTATVPNWGSEIIIPEG